MSLSVILAMIASYTALDLAGRVRASSGRARVWWIVGGAMAASAFALWMISRDRVTQPLLGVAALVMGVAVAGMHYSGMAAAHFIPDQAFAALAAEDATASAAAFVARKTVPRRVSSICAAATLRGVRSQRAGELRRRPERVSFAQVEFSPAGRPETLRGLRRGRATGG